jgi:hypothetical protein
MRYICVLTTIHFGQRMFIYVNVHHVFLTCDCCVLCQHSNTSCASTRCCCSTCTHIRQPIPNLCTIVDTAAAAAAVAAGTAEEEHRTPLAGHRTAAAAVEDTAAAVGAAAAGRCTAEAVDHTYQAEGEALGRP